MHSRELLSGLIALLRRATPATKIKLVLFSAARVVRRVTGVTLYNGGVFDFDFGRFVVEQGHGHLGTIAEIFGSGIYGRSGFAAREGDTCLDIGANVGCVSIFWRGTNRTGRIVAVEPHPDTVQALRANIALNEATGATIVEHAAIGARPGEIELVVDAGGQSMARHPSSMIVGETFAREQRIKVPSVTLDALCERHGITRIDLLKIDVEGFESEALAGAKRTLPLTDRVMLEYHSPQLRQQCTATLIESGFSVDDVEPLLFASRANGRPA